MQISIQQSPGCISFFYRVDEVFMLGDGKKCQFLKKEWNKGCFLVLGGEEVKVSCRGKCIWCPRGFVWVTGKKSVVHGMQRKKSVCSFREERTENTDLESAREVCKLAGKRIEGR